MTLEDRVNQLEARVAELEHRPSLNVRQPSVDLVFESVGYPKRWPSESDASLHLRSHANGSTTCAAPCWDRAVEAWEKARAAEKG